MEYDLGALIRVIHDINRNIWLGDFDKAKEIANIFLEKISKQMEIEGFLNFAGNLRKLIRDAKKEAQEKEIEDIDFWVTKRVSEKMEREKRNPIDNIIGVLIIRLSKLSEMLDYIVGSTAQKTLENFKEKDLDRGETLQRREKYKFAVQRFPDRWEVRAISENEIQLGNLKKLGDQLKDFYLFVKKLPSGEQSRTFEVYSQSMYAEILVQAQQVEFHIRTILTDDSRQRIEKFVETVMNSLST
jgi:uncharacterized protein (DUF2267 family)